MNKINLTLLSDDSQELLLSKQRQTKLAKQSHFPEANAVFSLKNAAIEANRINPPVNKKY